MGGKGGFFFSNSHTKEKMTVLDCNICVPF